MTINLNGLPLKDWNNRDIVKKWLRENHSAYDLRVKNKQVNDPNESQKAIWKYLK
jgi:hypothetical protein